MVTLEFLERAGYVVRGVLYVVMGGLAFTILVQSRMTAVDFGRMALVSLTAAGTRKIEQLFPLFNAEEVEVTSHLDAAQQDALARLLRSMYRAVERNGDAGSD